MSDFVSKFDGKRLDHRAQMIAWLLMLAREVRNGPEGLKFKANPFASAKRVGWIPKTCRTKKQGLVYLVDLARQGFGYVPKGTVLDQYQTILAAQRRSKQKKAS